MLIKLALISRGKELGFVRCYIDLFVPQRNYYLSLVNGYAEDLMPISVHPHETYISTLLYTIRVDIRHIPALVMRSGV